MESEGITRGTEEKRERVQSEGKNTKKGAVGGGDQSESNRPESARVWSVSVVAHGPVRQ